MNVNDEEFAVDAPPKKISGPPTSTKELPPQTES
jgi:hypothetical protein